MLQSAAVCCRTMVEEKAALFVPIVPPGLGVLGPRQRCLSSTSYMTTFEQHFLHCNPSAAPPTQQPCPDITTHTHLSPTHTSLRHTNPPSLVRSASVLPFLTFQSRSVQGGGRQGRARRVDTKHTHDPQHTHTHTFSHAYIV